MSNIELCEAKSQKRRGPSTAPRDPDKLFKIIDMRDVQRLSWRQISEELGDTHQGPYLLYNKWHSWALKHIARNKLKLK